MVMPFLRLFVIYFVIALAVIGIFKRDAVSRFVFGEPETVATAPAEETATPEPEAPKAAEAVEPKAEPPAAPAPLAAPVADTEAADAPEPVSGHGHDGALQMPVVDAAPAASADEGTRMAALPEPTPEPTPEPAEAPQKEAAAPAEAPAASGTLADARKAYWAGNVEKAGAILADLAKASPDDPQILGELGNFQYAQRQFAGAAESYLRAGELLIAKGQGAQAQALVPVLQQLDPQKAGALVQALQAKK